MWRRAVGMAVVLWFMGMASVAWGVEPLKKIPYSKKTSLAAGKYTMRFSLFNTVTAGNMLWSENQKVKIPSGLTINTYLGSVVPLDAGIFSQQLWVQVERKTNTGYKIIGVRDRLNVAPYALWSIAGNAGPQRA